jgi:hypothetical protein
MAATFIDELPQESHNPFLEHQHFIQELLDDHTDAEIVTAIAARISTDYNLHTTARQVKSIGLKAGWLRASSGAKKAAKRAETRQQVENAISNGPARIFGRRWLITWLRLHGFKAHQVDVSIAQRLIDPDGVASHLPGLRKARLENYITSGPNFLWCLDGHDKFLQYGIQIYAAVDAYPMAGHNTSYVIDKPSSQLDHMVAPPC